MKKLGFLALFLGLSMFFAGCDNPAPKPAQPAGDKPAAEAPAKEGEKAAAPEKAEMPATPEKPAEAK